METDWLEATHFLSSPPHSTGSKSGSVIGDHIPPTKLIKDARAKRASTEASLAHLPEILRQVRQGDPPPPLNTAHALLTLTHTPS